MIDALISPIVMPNESDPAVASALSQGSVGLDLLPDSRTRGRKGGVQRPDGWWVPVYCANCSSFHGYVHEEATDFAFFLCDDCAEKQGPIAGTYMVPDAVFRQKLIELQIETAGRMMTHAELFAELSNPDSTLSALCRERLQTLKTSA